ncbi:class I SAM-dependent methyltransferase [Arachidicoccus sp.]|uniref:class I SAM-dependent methyltransferase n=1 Tax=Arachidicoccus sp. TaxID=1872624 RepID=UPI003D216D93
MDNKINYGIDAPKVIRNLLMIGFVALLAGLAAIPLLGISWLLMLAGTFIYTGFFCLAEGLLMIWYSKYGKLKHRDRMLKLFSFSGREKVLDIGTGRGLLMIGAAKHLPEGRSVGIDIWNAEDLSGNNFESAMQNARLEGVSNRVEVLNENIIRTSFESASFDLILSNLCLHNIYEKESRKAACEEIYRLLKPGAKAIISDFRHTAVYKNIFEQLGMTVKKHGPFIFNTFPPLTIIVAEKN